ARFLAQAETTFARGGLQEVPVDWRPAPHERRIESGGVVVQLRDGVERISWQGRAYHRKVGTRLGRREHRVVRAVKADGERRYVASLEALGTVLEDHLPVDERGKLLRRHAIGLDQDSETPLAAPWGDALGALLPLEATPLLAGAIEAAWRELRTVWGPVPGDLVGMEGATIRISPKLVRAYRTAMAAAPAAAGRTVARQLVREVLGLVGPKVRQTAAVWLESLPLPHPHPPLPPAP